MTIASKRTIVVASMLGVVAIMAVIGLWSKKSAKAEIKIGAVLPLTGDAAQWGLGAQRGIQLAVDEVNSVGGIAGNKVVVVFEDDQLQPRIGTQAMQKLISIDRVPAVIGSISSSVTLAIAPIAEQNSVVLISPASTSHDITSAGDFIFRTIPSDIYEGGVMARFAHRDRNYHEVAIAAVNAAGTKGMADAFEDTFTSLGGKVSLYELVPQGGTDFRATISKIIARKPQAVYVVGFPLETGHMVKQLVELGYRGQIISAQPAEDPQVRAIAGTAAEGLILTTTTVDPRTGSVATRNYASKYKAKYEQPPAVWSFEAYDAARLILQAIATRGASGPAIRDYLYTVKNFDGASGTFSIDSHGDVEKAIQLRIVRGGELSPLP